MSKSKPQVFKVQRPLVGPSDFVLVYNRAQTICGQFTMDKRQMRQILGDEHKVFWKGRLNGTIVEFNEKMPQQNW